MTQIDSVMISGCAPRRWWRKAGPERGSWRASPSSCPFRLPELACLLAVIVPLVAAQIGSYVTWNLTTSMPRGLYWRRADLVPARGNSVLLQVPADVAPLFRQRKYLPDGALLLKTVAGIPGDSVCLSEGAYRVNGALIGTIRDHDSLGRPLVPAQFCGVVPAGQAFVATEAPFSFDSRYFGSVALATLTVVTPLWTF